jgi:hypothetical protein
MQEEVLMNGVHFDSSFIKMVRFEPRDGGLWGVAFVTMQRGGKPYRYALRGKDWEVFSLSTHASQILEDEREEAREYLKEKQESGEEVPADDPYRQVRRASPGKAYNAILKNIEREIQSLGQKED